MEDRPDKVHVFHHEGFTLLEIIGVLAVLATLMALIVPNFLDQMETATREGEDGSLQAIAEALETSVQENRSLPNALSDLSPNYTSAGSTQLTQNRQSFPRYYIPHPTMSGFSNGTGLNPSDLDDARYLLISNLSADAAPTITNATEFDAWWNTDETGTPDLKIYRGNLGRMFRLLSLTSNGIGGSYTIDGTTTNPGCSALPDHTRYHLHGTPVGLDEAATYATPEVNFGLETDNTYQFHCGLSAGSKWRKNHGPKPYCWALWLTTDRDVSGSGATCLNSWSDAEIFQIGNPDLAFDPGTTNGTFSSVADMENFGSSGLSSLGGIHVVTTTITVGGSNPITLNPGDLLLSTSADERLSSVNTLQVKKEDVFVFQPTTPWDYSSGTFSMLIDESDLGVGDVRALTLVELTTTVGATDLSAGSFLLSFDEQDVRWFVPTSLGTNTAGTLSLIIEGDDIGIQKKFFGLELIETQTNLGNTVLQPGQLLATLEDTETVGSNNISTRKQDIFSLDITGTELDSGTDATAALLLDGSDVNLNNDSETIMGFSLSPIQ